MNLEIDKRLFCKLYCNTLFRRVILLTVKMYHYPYILEVTVPNVNTSNFPESSNCNSVACRDPRKLKIGHL